MTPLQETQYATSAVRISKSWFLLRALDERSGNRHGVLPSQTAMLHCNMRISDEDKMTDAQLKAMKEFAATIEEETLQIGREIDRCRPLVDLPLPATSHTGVPVTHGARMQLGVLLSYWNGRLILNRMFLTEKEINAIFIKHDITVRI
jgi:hypothetical protein